MKEAIERLEATPSVYVETIEDRLSNNFINDENLIDYLTLRSSYEQSISILVTMASRDLDRQGSLGVLTWLYYEVSKDIDMMKEALISGTLTDPESFKKAMYSAEHLFINILNSIQNLGDISLLEHAINRHTSSNFYVQRFIEAYSRVAAGAFPPIQTLDVSGEWQLVGLPLTPFKADFDAIFSAPLP